MEAQKIKDEIEVLKNILAEKEATLSRLQNTSENMLTSKEILTNEEITKYSRQLILQNFGVKGQLILKKTSFLIVGVGGLGCPAAQYLVAAGCGTIGLVDYDISEKTNFHRQILFTEQSLNIPKVYAAKKTLELLNRNVQIETYHFQLDKTNSLELIEKYDIILDCTDNMPSKYLLNDICVLKGKPLVSGSSVKYDGQITVYNFNEGPCYRCIFPSPPSPELVSNCADNGVLGPVVGVIGSLQALEAIKIALKLGDILSGRLLIFDGLNCIFRIVKLRSKHDKCNFCSKQPEQLDLPDYEEFCGTSANDDNESVSLLSDNYRILASDYKNFAMTTTHLLIDVREAAEFEICKLDNSINIPLIDIIDNVRLDEINAIVNKHKLPIIVLCRRGNDSQIAVSRLMEELPPNIVIKDIIGGLHAWHYQVDPTFPFY